MILHKEQKILTGTVVAIGVLGLVLNFQAPTGGAGAISPASTYTKKDFSDYRPLVITEDMGINEISEIANTVESKLNRNKSRIRDLETEIGENSNKIVSYNQELQEKKTVNIFNTDHWYDVVGVWDNKQSKEKSIASLEALISETGQEINRGKMELEEAKDYDRILSNESENVKSMLQVMSKKNMYISDVYANETPEDMKRMKKGYIDKFIEEHPQRDLYTVNEDNGSSFVNGLPPFIAPTGDDGIITSDFGYRTHPIYGSIKYHSGTDIGVDYGEPIVASNYGLVVYSGWYDGFGKTVILSHAQGVYTLYGHNSELLVSTGDTVQQGERIALAGSTGNSTGPHCHFSMWINEELVNPLDHIENNY